MLSEQEKKEFLQKIQSNKHEIYVVSFEEMDVIIKSSPLGSKQIVQDAWQKIKGRVGLGASYYASADDAVIMAKLVGDLGSIGAKAYIKNYGGKPHIILKGRAGLRNVLTGTKYGIKNPKVVIMGLGKAGAVSAAKQGGIISIVLLSAFRVADYCLTDQATLSQLVGMLATDVVKVGIATGASIITATAVAGLTTVAVGPILAVVVVGVGVSMLLEYADNSLGISNRVIAGLDELGENAENYIEDQKRQAINSAGRAIDSVIEHAISSARAITIRWVQSKVREYLSPLPRVR
ncbi:MAG: hypothetical protein GY799_28240 [Desulfobulbaceae bacterium]|nr:hypothetical protein [Desulfobulbaceae bacterium]